MILAFIVFQLVFPSRPAVYAQSGSPFESIFNTVKQFIPGGNKIASPKPTESGGKSALKKQNVLAAQDDVKIQDSVSNSLGELEGRITTLENQGLFNSSSSYSQNSSSVGTNLIRNSSFESADSEKPRQWTYIYDSTTSNTKQSKEGIRSGSYGIKFAGATSTTGGLDLGISQPETETVPGRTYTLSVYLKHTNVAGDTYVRLGFWDKYNNRFGPMKTVAIAGTKDWYRISSTVETTGLITDYANWYPMLEVRGLKEGGAVYFDDVQLEEGSVLTLYNSAAAGGTNNSFNAGLGDGSILATTTGTIYPAQNGIGSLGTSSNKWHDLYLSKATINENGDLSLDGDATVGGDLTVNDTTTLKGNVTLGDSSSDTITFTGTPTFSTNSTFSGGITVGANGEFTINSSGNITKIRGVAYSFPSAQGAANEILINDGTGALSWGTFGAASVTADSLDFAQFADAMTLDADTSINLYNSGAKDLRFYNSNSSSELLFLDGSTGNVGIGTTAPTYPLEIAGSGSVLALSSSSVKSLDWKDSSNGKIWQWSHREAGDNSFQLWYNDGVGNWSRKAAIGPNLWQFDTNTSFIGNIASSGSLQVTGSGPHYFNNGNVGIGTTNPGAKLQINTGSDGTIGQIIRANSLTQSANLFEIQRSDLYTVFSIGSNGRTHIGYGSDEYGLGTLTISETVDTPLRVGSGAFPNIGRFYNTSGSLVLGVNSVGIISARDGSDNAAPLTFQTGTSERVRIDTNGNVGIGTTGPQHKLDIVNNGTVVLRVYNSGSAAYQTSSILLGGFGNSEYSTFVNTLRPGGSYGDLTIRADQNASSFMFLNGQNGNVGIGTTLPASLLDVAGTSWLRGVAGGTSGLFVNSSGNVGIGTTGPGAKLEVNGTTGLMIKDTSGNNPKLILQESIGVNNSWNEGQIDVSGRTMRFLTEGTLALSIGANGNGRISSPTFGFSLDTGRLALKKQTGDTVLYLGLKENDVLTTGGYDFLRMINSSNTTTFFRVSDIGNMFFKAGNYIAPISDATNALNIANAAGAPFVTFDSTNGFVGIGTTNPGAKLEVAGGGKFGYLGSGITAPSNGLLVQGNVGIGTTAPAYALDVAGDINTTGDIRKNGAAYTNPDYVFEPDYGLMSLEDLKIFVAENRHLPGVPSSEDILRDGVKLFEQTRLNLEKTEEAYLYLFDLNDRVSTLSLSLPTTNQELTQLKKVSQDQTLNTATDPTNDTLELDDEGKKKLSDLLEKIEINDETGVLEIQAETHFIASLRAKAQSVFEGVVRFMAEVIFEKPVQFLSDVTIKGRITYEDKDKAGTATIKKGQGYVDIKFDRDYSVTPIVNITLKSQKGSSEDEQQQIERDVLGSNTSYIVTRESTNGFRILLSSPSAHDLLFAWTAVAVKDANLSESDESQITPSQQIQPSIEPSSSESATPTKTPSESEGTQVEPTVTPTTISEPTLELTATPTPTGVSE